MLVLSIILGILGLVVILFLIWIMREAETPLPLPELRKTGCADDYFSDDNIISRLLEERANQVE